MSPERPALPSLNNWLLTTEIATAPYFPILNALMSEMSLATSFFSPTCQIRVLNTVMRTIFKNTFNKIFFCLEVKIKRPLPFLCPPLRSMCLLHHGEWLHTHHSTCPALPCWPPPRTPLPPVILHKRTDLLVSIGHLLKWTCLFGSSLCGEWSTVLQNILCRDVTLV